MDQSFGKVVGLLLFYFNTFSRLSSEPPHYVKCVQRAYGNLLSDVMHSIPPKLLASLLHEELQEQRDRRLFFEGATGGALAFVPFGHPGSRSGCLLYPGSKSQDCLSILCLLSFSSPHLKP